MVANSKTKIKQVAELKIEGYSNSEISEKLHISSKVLESLLAAVDKEWSASYISSYKTCKTRKLAELSKAKQICWIGIKNCDRLNDFINLSKFLNNLMMILKEESMLLGLKEPPPEELLESLPQDFIDWQTEKYFKEKR